MPALRPAAAVALPLALTVLTAAPASAHGTMGDPVSRVAQCYAEGPESPDSAACAAAVATGGTQALYDWNGVRVGDAAGRHRELIPDGRLCSADNDEFKGLDLARADWPATAVSSGPYTFRYRVTAQHKGTFTVYLTQDGYDPAQPLAWDDLDLSAPVAVATDPVAADGFSTFSGSLPERTGRHLLYAVWQRSDSPEAFYSCSDVTFGGATATRGDGDGADAAPASSAGQLEAGADGSTVGHHGHGGLPRGAAGGTPAAPTTTGPAAASGGGSRLTAAGGAPDLAETGGDGGTAYLAVGGAGALALGAATLFASVRRRAAHDVRPGR